MKKLKLEDLKLNSFISELTEKEAQNVVGGIAETATASYTGVGSCCDPSTTEANVISCGIKTETCKKVDR